MNEYFFILIILFNPLQSQIFNNPRMLGSNEYPFLFSPTNDDFNYILTSNKCYKINKDTSLVVWSIDKLEYSSDVIYIVDKSNNIYLYFKNENKNYIIVYEPEVSFTLSTFTFDSSYSSMIFVGAIPENNDYIIYGKINNIYFFTLILKYQKLK